MKNIVLIKKISGWLLIVAMLMGGSLDSTAQCNYTLACNDLIQLSLGSDCEELVTPDIMLENPEFEDIWYEITVMDSEGEIVPDATVNVSHIGMTLTVQVTLIFNDCNLSCWGYLFVEDKLAPQFDCPDDITVDCGTDLSPSTTGNVLPGDVTDCSEVTDIRFVDESEIMPCSDEYSEVITRTWLATDIYGNESTTCAQRIYIMAAVIDSVELPMDFIENCEDLGIPIEDLTPEITGKPTLIECSNIQYFFTDLDFPLCGNGIKIRREWHVLDWCTGRDTIGFQTIKVEDTQPPVIECGTSFYEIESNVDNCFATYTVPLPDLDNTSSDPLRPNLLYDCSDVTFTISYAPFPPELECNSLDEAQEILEDAGLTLEFIDILPNADGEYIIEALPVGCNWIKYTFDDGCGNEVFCTKDVFVVDIAPPSAICEGYTVVSIDHTGWANILAESLDDHSWDSCDGPLSFSARRVESECDDLPEENPDDLGFDDYLHFCCEDVGSYVLVELKVMDEQGNYNFCQASVFVDDKIPPLVDCPADLTLDCTEDYEDTSITGVPGYEDNCSAEIEQDYREFLNDCGIGYVLIDHSIKDNANNEILCTQRIDVINKNPLTSDDIDWPDDIETTVCDEEALDPHVLGSYPIIDYDSPCADPAVSVDDLRFYDVEDACYKIVRTWTVVDWCDVQGTYFTHVQKILVFNEDGPVFHNCDDRSFEADEDCEAIVNILLDITDDCTPTNKLDISWIIRSNETDNLVDAGAGLLINNQFDAGSYEVTVTAIDECDNVETCSFDFEISDDAHPTPVCITEVVWVLDVDGTTTVWASDFNFKSYDGCRGEEGLTFSFNAAGNQPSMDFDCSDIPDGISAEIPLTMYVIDEDGNSDFCSVILVLQDNTQDACVDEGATLPRIEGTIFRSDMVGIDNIEVGLYNMTSGQDTMQMTHDNGGFMFEDLAKYEEYKVKPEKNGSPLDGVSTLDLVLIQKHILGQQQLDSPYKMIAADVNKSSSISAVDLVEVRKLILGIYDEFPNHTSWEFVAMNIGQLETSNPWDYMNELGAGAISEDMNDFDFVAVKIGDVNGNALGDFASPEIENRSSHVMSLIYDDVMLEDNVATSIQLKTDFQKDVEGFQCSFVLADGVQLVGLGSSMNGFTESNWSQHDNIITISWSDALHPAELNLTIDLVADKHISVEEAFDVNPVFSSEAYDQNEVIYELDLRGANVETNQNTMFLSQNSPNPFADMTMISAFIPEGKRADFMIQDVNGKALYTEQGIIGQGHTQFRITADVFNDIAGIYFYSLRVEDELLTRKLVYTK